MFPQKERTQKELDQLVHALAWNDAFGCYTRAGFEKMIWPEIADKARWIIPADAMIKQALASLRLMDYVAGQWKSGDEFLICLTQNDHPVESGQRERLDPQSMMNRLIDALKKQGMSATFAIVPVISSDLVANVKPAVDQVYAAKKQRGGQSR
jgi:hypothetical protein